MMVQTDLSQDIGIHNIKPLSIFVLKLWSMRIVLKVGQYQGPMS